MPPILQSWGKVMRNTRQETVAKQVQNSRTRSTEKDICILSVQGGGFAEVGIANIVKLFNLFCGRWCKCTYHYWRLQEIEHLEFDKLHCASPCQCSYDGGLNNMAWVKFRWRERKKTKRRTSNLVGGICDCDVVDIWWAQVHRTLMKVELFDCMRIVFVCLLDVRVLCLVLVDIVSVCHVYIRQCIICGGMGCS